MLYLFTIFLYLVTPIERDNHAIYISVLEIDKQQMKVKVFTDDLNDAIRNDSATIEVYFKKKIRLQINEQPIEFSLQEVSEEGDSHWITFNLDAPVKWQSFYLQADYFMELFPDQTNVVKFIGENTQFYKLTKLNPTCSFTF